MSVLRLNVLGPPQVYHDGSRLTFALLLYLAVEGGMHPRSHLAALLWPDSEPYAARTALRNALTLLRRLLADLDPSAPAHSHLLREHELLGLDPHAPYELDLEVVQQAYQQAQRLSSVPSEPACAPAGDGQRRAGDPGERAASVATGRGRGAGRRRGAGGGRRQWHPA